MIGLVSVIDIRPQTLDPRFRSCRQSVLLATITVLYIEIIINNYACVRLGRIRIVAILLH